LKLLGFSFAGAPGPVTAGYLSLGELTAVIGPNDAGKTRLVRTFSQAMLPDTALQAERASFFVCLDPREVETLLDAVERWTDGIDLWADRGPEEGGPDDLDLVARTAAAISEVYDERTAPGWREIHEEMCRMGYFSLSADAEQESPAVALSWCTPPPSSLTPRMRDVVAGFLAAAFGDDSDFEGIDVDAVARAVVSGPEPIELVRLGTLPASVLPVPVTLPTSDDAIGQLATDAISELMRHLDWAKRAEDSLRRLGAGGESSLRPPEVGGLVEV
jgi:energy-coupling factor transporter ATP-binding protein EcfA2